MIVIIIVFIVHLLCAVKGQVLIFKSNSLTYKQKVFNSLLLWAIPILWFWVLQLVVKPTEGSIGKRGTDVGGYGGETVRGSDMG